MLILLLSPLEFEVPMLVEILILLDMGLLDLFLLLLMSEHQLLVLHVVLLLLQLGDPILGHLSLYNIVTKSNMSQAHTRILDAKNASIAPYWIP